MASDDPDGLDEFEVDEEEIAPSWWHQGNERPESMGNKAVEKEIQIAVDWSDRDSLPQAIARELACLGISGIDFDPAYVVLLDVNGVALTSEGDPVPLQLDLDKSRFPLRVVYNKPETEGIDGPQYPSGMEASVPRPPPSECVLVASGDRSLKSRVMPAQHRHVVPRPAPTRGALRGASGRPVRINARPQPTEEELKEEEDELVAAVLTLRAEVERTCQRSAALVGTRYSQMALDLQMNPVEYAYLQKVTKLQANMELMYDELAKLRGLDNARSHEDVTDLEEPDEVVGCESSSKTTARKHGPAGSALDIAECSESARRESGQQGTGGIRRLPLNAYGIDQGEEVFNETPNSLDMKFVPPR